MALSRRPRDTPGDLFPGFSDVAEIDAGSLATVYQAREIGTDRRVALKLLNLPAASPQALDSFERESLALGAVSSHPHIVTVYRAFRTADGRPVLVLEPCAGSIAERLRLGHGLPVPEVVSIGVKIAGALETAHRAQVLHGDVKPQNVLITESGEPALADFGVAMLRSSSQTTAGLFDFSTLHAAPELLEGGAASAATDVYELASSLYQLIAGRAAFGAYDGESPASVILRILRDPVQPLGNADVPPELSDLLIRAMSKDEQSRPRTAAEFGERLGEIETAQGWPRTALLVGDSAPNRPRQASLRRPMPPEPPLPPVPEPLPPMPEPPPPPGPEPPLPPIPEPVPPAPEPGRPPEPEPAPAPPAPAPPGPHPGPAPEPPLPPAPTPPVHPEPEPPQPREPEPPLHPEPEPPARPEPPLPPAPTPPVHPEPEPPPAPEPPMRPDPSATADAQPSAIWRPIESPAGDVEDQNLPAADEREEQPARDVALRPAARMWASVPVYPPDPTDAFTGHLTLDPMSLRRKVTLRSGAAWLVADETGLVLRKGLRRTELAWDDIAGFEPRTEGADSTQGRLVALTRGGPVELPATRRSVGDLRYVLALLDAYRRRARIRAAG
ncbi:MAG TPA: serine/threonine-protein kinase [Jatrophihabitans sp.]|nr:serine/threonine-protein kinase [Jatrophihabitans sp.]